MNKSHLFIRRQKVLRETPRMSLACKLAEQRLGPHSPSGGFNRTWLLPWVISISLLFLPKWDDCSWWERPRRCINSPMGNFNRLFVLLDSLSPSKISPYCLHQSCTRMAWFLPKSHPSSSFERPSKIKLVFLNHHILPPCSGPLQRFGFARWSTKNSTLSYQQAVGKIWGQVWTQRPPQHHKPGSHLLRSLTHFPYLHRGPL